MSKLLHVLNVGPRINSGMAVRAALTALETESDSVGRTGSQPPQNLHPTQPQTRKKKRREIPGAPTLCK